MTELTLGDALKQIAACKQRQTIAGNFDASGAIHLAEMMIAVLSDELNRMVAALPQPAQPTPEKPAEP